MNQIFKSIEQHAIPMSGTVKWYDASKCFGFVIAPGFDQDFLLHRHVLEVFGRTSVTQGAKIDFHYEAQNGGLRITEVVSVEPQLAEPAPGQCTNTALPARVKWFDRKKGYGFVNVFDDVEDIFIGQAVLNKHAMEELQTGEALRVQVVTNESGKAVSHIYDWVPPC